MPNKYSHITSEMFTEELERLVSQMTTGELMSLPGFYEIVSEHFNNDILDNLSNDDDQEQPKC